SEMSKRVIGPIPDRPAINASQFFSTPVPSGVISPKPVTTTRRSRSTLRLIMEARSLRGHTVQTLTDAVIENTLSLARRPLNSTADSHPRLKDDLRHRGFRF